MGHKDEPVAAFTNPTEAEEVLRDIAELQRMFNVNIVIEGHTKHSAQGRETFWETLAMNRAKLIVDRLAARGIAQKTMKAVSKPGKSGLDRATVVVHLDIF